MFTFPGKQKFRRRKKEELANCQQLQSNQTKQDGISSSQDSDRWAELSDRLIMQPSADDGTKSTV